MLQFCSPVLNPYIPKKGKLEVAPPESFFICWFMQILIFLVSVDTIFRLLSNTMEYICKIQSCGSQWVAWP